MTESSLPLIRLDGISKQHPFSPQMLLDHIDLEIHAGESILLSGRSGSGKSLLLRAIALLEPVDSGEIYWNGHPVSNSETPQYRSQVMYIRQTVALGEGSVTDCLSAPFDLQAHRHHRLDLSRIQQQLQDLNYRPDLLQQDVENLSGGERQIVQLLRALQLAPQVLLLDEPTASTDPETTQRIESLLRQWCSEDSQRSLVWVSHSREQIQRLHDFPGRRHFGVEQGKLIPSSSFLSTQDQVSTTAFGNDLESHPSP